MSLNNRALELFEDALERAVAEGLPWADVRQAAIGALCFTAQRMEPEVASDALADTMRYDCLTALQKYA